MALVDFSLNCCESSLARLPHCPTCINTIVVQLHKEVDRCKECKINGDVSLVSAVIVPDT